MFLLTLPSSLVHLVFGVVCNVCVSVCVRAHLCNMYHGSCNDFAAFFSLSLSQSLLLGRKILSLSSSLNLPWRCSVAQASRIFPVAFLYLRCLRAHSKTVAFCVDLVVVGQRVVEGIG